MSALPEFVAEPLNEAGALLDDFVRYRGYRPRSARLLRRRDELPWIFRGYVRPSNGSFAWRAWTRQGGICFLAAELAAAASIRLGAPVLDVRCFDPEGLPFPSDLWQRLPDGTWLRCDPRLRAEVNVTF